MKRLVVLGAIGLLLQACAWVELTPDGKKTRVLSAAEVGNCTKLGKTTVSVKADIAGLDRDPRKVHDELEALARNSAVDMKGDTVVPITEPKGGRQVFEVYRCVIP